MPKNPNPLQVMGIVNVTPDSFSDGGEYNRLNDAIDHVAQLISCLLYTSPSPRDA